MSTAHSPSVIGSQVPLVGASPKRWTREEYYRLAEEGFFEGQHVELIGGQIVMMSPQGYSHYFSSDRIAEILRDVFGDDYWVRQQAPLSVPEIDIPSEPEPHVSVVRGSRNDYTDHPTTAVLVVEVARTSLAFDTQTKPHVYAKAGVPDYWMLDLVNRQLVVHREPTSDERAPFGHRYGNVEKIEESGKVTLLEKPEVSLAIADMHPRDA